MGFPPSSTLLLELTIRADKLGLIFRDAPEINEELFVGRRSELQEMQKILKPNELDSKQRKLVLGGMGGIGKTQLAIAYAKCHWQSYDSVFWLNATTESLLQNSIRSITSLFDALGDLSGYGDTLLLTFFHKWLSQSNNTRWLLILDNYDDPQSYALRKFLPLCSHGSIIVTTRQTMDVAEGFACAPIHLRPLVSLEEALKVLATRSGRQILESGNAHYAHYVCGR